MLLTTQYLEEADQLADRIAVIDSGRVIAEGTSNELKVSLGAERIALTLTSPDALDETLRVLERILGGCGHAAAGLDPEAPHCPGPAGAEELLLEVLGGLEQGGIVVTEAALTRPTLDDVFLDLTGHPASAEPSPQPRSEAEVGA